MRRAGVQGSGWGSLGACMGERREGNRSDESSGLDGGNEVGSNVVTL